MTVGETAAAGERVAAATAVGERAAAVGEKAAAVAEDCGGYLHLFRVGATE